MLGFRKRVQKKEPIFCSECGENIIDEWVDSYYYPDTQILVRHCSGYASTYFSNKHYWALTGKSRPRTPKFDPYTGKSSYGD